MNTANFKFTNSFIELSNNQIILEDNQIDAFEQSLMSVSFASDNTSYCDTKKARVSPDLVRALPFCLILH